MDWADDIAGTIMRNGMGDDHTCRLIADALRAERERCAQIAESVGHGVIEMGEYDRGLVRTSKTTADYIRRNRE